MPLDIFFICMDMTCENLEIMLTKPNIYALQNIISNFLILNFAMSFLADAHIFCHSFGFWALKYIVVLPVVFLI